MKTAMRAGEKERLGTVRLALAAIKQREVDERISLDDTQVLAVLEKMIKQRREAITQFQAAAAPTWSPRKPPRSACCSSYLPAQLSEAEIVAPHPGGDPATGAASSRTWARSWRP